MTTVAMLGAGLIGAGMVENWLTRGVAVNVWNRSPNKLDALVERGATAFGTAADAVRGADRVHLALAEDDAVDGVVRAMLPGLQQGVYVVDHSTNLPNRVAERAVWLGAEGVRYVHCPVFMSPANARAGTGVMLMAASAADAEALMPALSAMTGRVWVVGARPDLAAVYKLLGNALIVGFVGVVGDALAVGANMGVDLAGFGQLLTQFNPAAMVPVAGARIARSETGDASFTLDLARKDVRLMIEAAGERPLVVLPSIAVAMDEAIRGGAAPRTSRRSPMPVRSAPRFVR